MHLPFPGLSDNSATSAFSALRCIGVSHQVAPAEIREALSFSPREVEPALRSARDAGIGRLVILSTCHRTELYVDVSHQRSLFPLSRGEIGLEWRLREWLAANRGVDRALVDTRSYGFSGMAAVHHLFRLACGLESVIPGEPQIVAQVAGAHARSVAAHAASPPLKRLFKAALRAGECAQAEVWGRMRRADLGTAAAGAVLRFLEETGRTFGGARVAVIGAGELGQLAITALNDAGAGDVTLLNRTHHRAAILAERHNVLARSLDDLGAVLRETDAAIFALADSKSVVSVDLIRDVMRYREGGRLALVDVGLPRNVDVRSRNVGGVTLLGIDDLGALPDERQFAVTAAFPLVEEIIRARTESLLHQSPSPSRKALGASA